LKLFQLLKNAGKWVYKGMEGIGDAEERFWATPMDREPIKWVSHARSLTKAVSWRFFGTLISWIVIFELTHKGKLAFIASGIELVVKIVLYYAHERVWNKVKWGRE
jgi:uncharacterized membrane protein